MKTITITPTLATQRVYATTLLNAKLNDGLDLESEVFDWAVNILGMEYDNDSVDYLLETLETRDLIKLFIDEIAKVLLNEVAENNFEFFKTAPVSVSTRVGLLYELVKANPHSGYVLDEIPISILNAVDCLSQDEILKWAFNNFESKCQIKRKKADEILSENGIDICEG